MSKKTKNEIKDNLSTLPETKVPEDKKTTVKTTDDQVNHINIAKDSASLKSTYCKDCLYWSSVMSSPEYGKCKVDPPSVHSGTILKEGSAFMYPLTLNILESCSKFKPKI